VATHMKRTDKQKILKIRCSPKTVRMWREELRRYQDAGLSAENLLVDGLKLVREQGYPKSAPVF